MLQETLFRVIVTAVFSIINYGIINYLIPPGDTTSFLLMFLIIFHVAITLGLILQIPKFNLKQVLSIIILSVLFALAVSYVVHTPPDSGWDVLWIFQVEFAAFIIYSYYCSYFEVGHFEYPALFFQSWRILLTLVMASFFSALVWGLLLLGSLLFDLLGIELFRNVVLSREMALIGGPIFFAVGVSLLANFSAILDKSREILLSFSKVLYPLLMMIGLLFFIALPFSQKPLVDFWGSLYFLMIIHLFLFNGVYQDGLQKTPYPPFLLWPLKIFLVLMPVFVMVGMYYPLMGLFQQPMTMDNLYLTIIGLLLLCYAASYAICVFLDRQNEQWLQHIQPVNKVLAVVVAIVFWLMATPVLNLHHWVG